MSGYSAPVSLKGSLSYSRARDKEHGLRSQGGESVSLLPLPTYSHFLIQQVFF